MALEPQPMRPQVLLAGLDLAGLLSRWVAGDAAVHVAALLPRLAEPARVAVEVSGAAHLLISAPRGAALFSDRPFPRGLASDAWKGPQEVSGLAAAGIVLVTLAMHPGATAQVGGAWSDKSH